MFFMNVNKLLIISASMIIVRHVTVCLQEVNNSLILINASSAKNYYVETKTPAPRFLNVKTILNIW